MMVFVHTIRFADERLLARYSAVSQTSAGIRRASSRRGRDRDERVLMIAISCEGWMLSHIWHASIFIPDIVVVTPVHQAISRFGSIPVISPAFDLFPVG